jgi:hypothetical protein
MENLTIFKILTLIVCVIIILTIIKFVSGIIKIISIILITLVILYLLYGITIDLSKIYNNTENMINEQYNSNNIFKDFVDMIKNSLTEIRKIFT